MRCELASPVAVDDAILGKSIPPFGVHQRGGAKLGSHMIRHRIADLRAIEGVQNTAEIQLAISTAYLGNVSKNLCTSCIGVEVAPHQILGFLCLRVNLCNAPRLASFSKQAAVTTNPVTLAIEGR